MAPFEIHRELELNRTQRSAFLFGPRQTGKTTLLRSLKARHYFDLLDYDYETSVKANPRLFWEQIEAIPDRSLVIIDEIQKIPELLNYVQKAIDQKKLRFLLSGSSARKLKKGAANLLGGRALDLRLHPLSLSEIGQHATLHQILSFGSLPHIVEGLSRKNEEDVRQTLRSYAGIYVREEVQAEAVVRRIGPFHRFLSIAAQCNGQIIEYAHISRESSVPMSTVKEYYTILEDTLIGEFLWPFDRSERKKARPKFYFFDPGVVRAIQNRLSDPPTPAEQGSLFETWFFRELVRIRDYLRKEHVFSFWRIGPHEIDFLVEGGRGPLLAIECKSGRTDISAGTVDAFKRRFPKTPLLVCSLTDRQPRKLASGVEVLPVMEMIRKYRDF